MNAAIQNAITEVDRVVNLVDQTRDKLERLEKLEAAINGQAAHLREYFGYDDDVLVPIAVKFVDGEISWAGVLSCAGDERDQLEYLFLRMCVQHFLENKATRDDLRDAIEGLFF